MQDKVLPGLNSQYHYCSCPGDARSQCISSHDIDIIKPGDNLAYLLCPYVSFFTEHMRSFVLHYQIPTIFPMSFASFPIFFRDDISLSQMPMKAHNVINTQLLRQNEVLMP